MEAAKEKNAQALADLTQWREGHRGAPMQYTEQRENLREKLLVRAQKRGDLKDLVYDPEKANAIEIQAAMDAALDAEVGIWDTELMEAGNQKLQLIEAVS